MTATTTQSRIGTIPGLPVTNLTNIQSRPRATPGSALVAEARLLVDQRRWKEACRALAAVGIVRDQYSNTPADQALTLEMNQLLAVAATHAGSHKLARQAIADLHDEPELSVATMHALTGVALARHQYEAADLLARKAVEFDSHDATGWRNLAASFAGLGWFDQTEECLDRAEALGLPEDQSWPVGSATNRWALSNTWAAVLTAVSFYFLGLLAVAIGLTVPFLVREVRIARLTDRLALVAADHWRTKHRFRMVRAAAVFAVLVAWVAIFSFA